MLLMVAMQIVTVAQNVPSEALIGRTFREILTIIDGTPPSNNKSPIHNMVAMGAEVNGIDRVYEWSQLNKEYVTLDDICDHETIGLYTNSMSDVHGLIEQLGFKMHGKNKPFKDELVSVIENGYRLTNENGQTFVMLVTKTHEFPDRIDLEIYIMP